MLVGGVNNSRNNSMSNKEEYYINLYVGGKFVCDPHVRYSGGDMVRFKDDPDTGLWFNTVQLIYFNIPDSRTLQDNLKVVWNDSRNINMLNYWVKHNEIDMYVEHEIAIFSNDDIMLTVETVESVGYGNEGVEVAGSKGGEGGEGVEGLGGEDVEVVGNKSGEGGEGVKGLGEEGIEVIGSQCGKSNAAGLENGDEGLNSIVKEAGDEGLEDEKVRQKVREVEGKTSRKAKETVLDETESESSRKQFEAEVPEKVEVEGLNDRVGREEEGNRTEYFDSDDHGSILGSDDNDNIDTCKRKRRRSRFPTYNPNSTSPHFCIGMLFKDVFEAGNYLGSLVSMPALLYGFLNKILMTTYIGTTTRRYWKAYAYALQPINGSHKWRKSGIEHVLPPVEKTMPGRLKKNKMKAKNEPKKVKSGQLSRAGLIMRCRKCGGEGHNIRSCLQPNTAGSRSSTSTRTRSQERRVYQEPISTQESTAAKKMKK
ncbi:hypothetical protein GOBAR_DD15436 [Gossypium barbadense]|nr:hypothetical protein GOBAR_DD15436 [Gossypium barbadense]